MKSTSFVSLDLQRPNYVTVYAVQQDRLTRFIHAAIYDGTALWLPPAGALVTIRYRRPDGVSGFYDTLEDGSGAYTINEDGSVDFCLAEQAIAVAGCGAAEINFYTAAGEKLSTAFFVLQILPSVWADDDVIESDPYLNILSEQIAAVLNAAESLTGMTASVSGLPTGAAPTVTVTGGSAGVPYNLAFGLPAGPRGPALQISSIAYAYQESSSSSTPPSGTWSTTPPASTTPGSYLWTRTTIRYEDNTTVTAYTVAYQGLNGTGAVNSVWGVYPDASGDVAPTADQLPALSDAAAFSGSGALVTIANGAAGAPIESLTVALEPIQEGEGDPDPDTNVRPISGRTGATVEISATTDPGSGSTVAVSWEAAAGIVYGGTVDLATGEVTVTWTCQTLTGNESFTLSTSSGYRRFLRSLSALGWPSAKNVSTTPISSHFRRIPSAEQTAAQWGAFRISTDGYLVLIDNGVAIDSVAALQTWLAGQVTAGTPVQFAYMLEEPLSFQLSPQQIKTLAGVNNIFSADGDVAVTVHTGLAGSVAAAAAKPSLLEIYPVGAIYVSTVATDPGTLFGGTWQSIEGRFLLGASADYAAGSTGGAADATVDFANGLAHVGFRDDTLDRLAINRKDPQDPDAAFAAINYATTPSLSGYIDHPQVPGAALSGTQELSILPPYLAVYMWRRTA